MLNFGTNALQSYARYSAPLGDWVEFNPCASKRALTRKNFWDEWLSERGSLLFENEIRNAYLMANADRKAEPIWSLAHSNNSF